MRRFFKRWMINTFIALLLIAWTVWPLACVIIAGTVAHLCGCQLDEGSIHPCVVAGVDLGGTLYALGMMGWFGIASLATGVPALGLFALIATA